MRKDRSRLWLCLTVVFIAIVYTSLLLLLKPQLDLSSWTLYGFTIMAFLLLIIQIAFGTGGIKAYPAFEYVNIAVTIGYTAFQFILGGVILMLFDGLPFVPVVCVEAVILVVYLVYTFISSAVLSHTENQEQRIDKSVTNVRLMITDLEMMAATQPDKETKDKLLEAAKEIRYQDVISSPELASLDLRIQQCVDCIRAALECEDGDADTAIKSLSNMLLERKLKCKALKL